MISVLNSRKISTIIIRRRKIFILNEPKVTGRTKLIFDKYDFLTLRKIKYLVDATHDYGLNSAYL